MNAWIRSGLAAACMLCAVAVGASTVGEKIDAGVGAASSVATRAGAAIERGANAAASGVERGVRAGAGAVKRGFKAAASGAERGASWAATGVERGVKAAQRGASAAAGRVGLGESKPREQPAPVETVVPKPLKKGG